MRASQSKMNEFDWKKYCVGARGVNVKKTKSVWDNFDKNLWINEWEAIYLCKIELLKINLKKGKAF